ncbi:MAG: ABC transporter ATP-binding protein [Candidatus Omnitrophota bacterium]
MRLFQPDFKQTKKQFELFLKFVRLILPHKAKWIFIILLGGFWTLLSVVNPYITKLVVDEGIMKSDLRRFIALAALGIVIFIILGAINGLKEYLEKKVSLEVKFSLNKIVFDKINKLSLSWFRTKSTGENIYKISNDIDRVNSLITTIPPKAVMLFPRVIFIFLIMLKLNYKIALFSLLLAPFLYIGPYYFIKKRRSIWEKLIECSQGIFKFLHESFSHSYLIKAFGKEREEKDKYLKILKDNIEIEKTSTKLNIFNSFVARIADKIIVGLITFYGGYHVIKGEMTLGSLTAILVYLGQLVGMQHGFIGFFQSTVLGLVSCERIAGILDEKEEITETCDAKDILIKKGEIEFKKVNFGYSKGKAILKDLDFKIEGGRHISLAGSSGQGKTTILNLIARLYDADSGEIMIDRQYIKDITLNSLKKQISMALQETFLFNTSVKDNILYGDGNASLEDVIRVSKISLVDSFTENLPEKYDTVIGENACKISEGQKQKIAIARALIKNPKVLILDEAFSSMDSASEDKIISNIKENFKDITVVSVSHRLSTVKQSDLVYFLNNSGGIEVGKPEELLEKNMEFEELFKGQRELTISDPGSNT